MLRNYSFANSGIDSRNRYNANRSYGYSKGSNYSHSHAAKRTNSAKMGKTKKGISCITAWNYSRGKGLITFVAVPSKKYTKTYSSQSGNKFTIYAVTMTVKRIMLQRTFFALYNEGNGKLIMDKIGMVADVRQRYCVMIKK